MSGSAGLWPIGPAAKPANPAPPPTRTSSASIGTILAHGLPCISTNMAKKNATPSDSALPRSSASRSDMGPLRLIAAAVEAAGQVPRSEVRGSGLTRTVENRSAGSDTNTRVDVVHLHDTMVRAYAGQAVMGRCL